VDEHARDRLRRSRALLGSLQTNVATERTDYVRERYVSEYHAALQPLESTGFDVAEFKVDPADIKQRSYQSNYITRETTYSTERYVEKMLFMAKLDAAIAYLDATLAQSKS